MGADFGHIGHGLASDYLKIVRGPVLVSAPFIAPLRALIGVTVAPVPGIWRSRGGGVLTVAREFLMADQVVSTSQAITPTMADFGQVLAYRETAVEIGGNRPGTSSHLVVIGPVDAIFPVLFQPAVISPTSGMVGSSFTITPAQYSGTQPIQANGILIENGVDVTAQINGQNYVSTQPGDLIWQETPANIKGPGISNGASAVIVPGTAQNNTIYESNIYEVGIYA